MIRTLATTLVAFAIIGPLVATSVVEGGEPQFDSPTYLGLAAAGGGTGNMWFSVRIPAGVHYVAINSTFYTTSNSGVTESCPILFGTEDILYDENGTIAGGAGDLIYGPQDAINVEGSGLPTVHQENTFFGPCTGYGKTLVILGCPTCAPTNESLTYVAFTAYAGDANWSFDVRTNDTAAVSVDSGNESFIKRSTDFSGKLMVQAEDAHANLDTALTIHNRGTLIAIFQPSAPYSPLVPHEAWVETPTGIQTCPCHSYEIAGADAWGPGDYAFHLTEASTGESVLFGASVRLPP